MTFSTPQIDAIKAFSDNYIWVIGAKNNKNIALVDPGDAQVCINYIEQHQCILSTILITHHHSDHVGGVTTLVEYCQQKGWSITVYGPANENIPLRNVALVENDTVNLPELDMEFSIIDLPGHTLGHIAYVDTNKDILFCGDTLFSGGCGRLFEGTPEQMHHSLSKLTALSDATKVYCTHEYTAANIDFALTVDPENFEVIHYFNQVKQLRENDQSTLPSTIGLEKKINPFLRCQEPALQESAAVYANKDLRLGVETFSALREWKNNF